jgi:hypothetical protein
MSPYDINLLTAERAKLVTGPVVSSDRITSRKGPANTDKNNRKWFTEIQVTSFHNNTQLNARLTYQENGVDPGHGDFQSGSGHLSNQ